MCKIRRFTLFLSFLGLFVSAAFLTGATNGRDGCGGNLTDNCFSDSDCKGGQICEHGRCISARPVQRTDAGTPEKKSDGATPEQKRDQGCRRGSCPAGEYCAANGTCQALPSSSASCTFATDAEGRMGSPQQSLKLGAAGYYSSQSGVAFRPDGRQLALLYPTSKNNLRLFDLQSGKVTQTFTANPSHLSNEFSFVAFTPDNKTIYANFYGPHWNTNASATTMKAWDLQSGKEIDVTTRYAGRVYRIAFSPNGRYAVTIQEKGTPADPILAIWDQSQQKRLAFFPLAVAERAAHRNNTTPLCQKDRECQPREFCKPTGRGVGFCTIQARQGAHLYMPTALVINDQGVVLSADHEGFVYRWAHTMSKGQRLFALSKEEAVLAAAFRQDGKVAALASRNELLLLDLSSNSITTRTKLSLPQVEGIAFPQKNLVRVSTRGYYSSRWYFWNTRQGHRPRQALLPSSTTTGQTLKGAILAASNDQDSLRLALLRQKDEILALLWRCSDPCKKVACTGATFCKFGRCVGPTPECKEDDTRPCYTGSQGTLGVGLCASGIETCYQGYWSGHCYNETLPTVEICDKKDNDCNGRVDEQCRKACSADMDCPAGEVCQDGGCVSRSAPCTPAPEECDGKDNDCDGAIDETCHCSTSDSPRQCEAAPGCKGTRLQFCLRSSANFTRWTPCLCNPSSCKANSDCSTGKQCLQGHCVPQTCGNHSDCKSNEVCATGTWRLRCVKRECWADNRCASGQQCISGRCPTGKCKKDQDCQSGQYCVYGYCFARID